MRRGNRFCHTYGLRGEAKTLGSLRSPGRKGLAQSGVKFLIKTEGDSPLDHPWREGGAQEAVNLFAWAFVRGEMKQFSFTPLISRCFCLIYASRGPKWEEK
jgi:hypothetical protein